MGVTWSVASRGLSGAVLGKHKASHHEISELWIWSISTLQLGDERRITGSSLFDSIDLLAKRLSDDSLGLIAHKTP